MVRGPHLNGAERRRPTAHSRRRRNDFGNRLHNGGNDRPQRQDGIGRRLRGWGLLEPYYRLHMPSGPDGRNTPLLVCHRGASALAPENSLEAFRLAMGYGVDFSELDVYVGRDGELIVSHDPVNDAAVEQAVPRLAQVFELVGDQMGIYVELKGAHTGAALGALVRDFGPRLPDLIVGSFVLDLVAEARTAAPDLPRSILFSADWRGRTSSMIEMCRAYACTYAHPCFRPIERELIDAFHAADLHVMTPHTNDADEARKFASMGVDVIASDDPRVILPLRTLTGA